MGLKVPPITPSRTAPLHHPIASSSSASGKLCVLCPYLPISGDDVFQRGQRLEPHRPTHVKFLRTNAQFRPEAEFIPIRKASRRVHVYRRGIDLVQKAPSFMIVRGDDTIRQLRAVASDMVESFVEASHHSNGQNEVQILHLPILLCGGDRPWHDSTSFGTTAHL